MKPTLLLLFSVLLTPFASKSTTFTFQDWTTNGGGIYYIQATVSNPTDDLNNISASFDCSSKKCTYVTELYVIRKNGFRVEGGGTNTIWKFWNAIGQDAIINYLQENEDPASMNAYFPPDVEPDDIKEICFSAKVANESASPLSPVIADTCLSGGGIVPPLPNQPFCKTADQTELNHGFVSGKDVAGHRITKSITFTCNEEISSTLTIMNSDVNMSGSSSGLTSKVLIDGKSQLKLNMQEGGNTHTLSSELNTTNGAKAGSYTGNTILTWSPD